MKYFAMGARSEAVKSNAIVVMVAEKPSIALSIATALSGGKFDRHSGPAKSCPIFTYTGTFKGHKATFKVTSVAGHIFSRDFSTKYQDWSIDPSQLFHAPTIRKLEK